MTAEPKPAIDLTGKRVLVVGLARTGIATALFCAARGARVTATEEPDGGNRLGRLWRGAGVGNLPAYSTTGFCHSPVGNAPPGLRRPPASPQPRQPASPASRRTGCRCWSSRRAGRVPGDRQPARLGGAPTPQSITWMRPAESVGAYAKSTRDGNALAACSTTHPVRMEVDG